MKLVLIQLAVSRVINGEVVECPICDELGTKGGAMPRSRAVAVLRGRMLPFEEGLLGVVEARSGPCLFAIRRL